MRKFSEDVSHMPEIKDSDVLNGYKALMPADWEALRSAVVHDVKNTISRNTEDKVGQEAGYCLALILQKLQLLRDHRDDGCYHP